MKKAFIIATSGVVLAIFVFLTIGFFFFQPERKKLLEFKVESKPTVTPYLLDRYSIESLSQSKFDSSDITIGKVVKNEADFSSRMFYFTVEGKKVSGVMNTPKKNNNGRAIILLRGYVDRSVYSPGTGSRRIGEYLAGNGFVTIAPDFLGYGESDNPSRDSLEARFQTYTTVLSLIESLSSFNDAFKNSEDFIDTTIDSENFGIWAHSNGGQIALAVLEATGKKISTVLWAPVTKPFPYSILYFSDEAEDEGKALRSLIAEFEQNHDAKEFSPISYLDFINSAIQLHQGNADDAVPKKWSDEFVGRMQKLKKNIEYFTYPEADHNFSTSDWNTAARRSLEFFREQMID